MFYRQFSYRAIAVLVVLLLSFVSEAESFKAECVEAVDGDTIRVKRGSAYIDVELFGIVTCPQFMYHSE